MSGRYNFKKYFETVYHDKLMSLVASKVQNKKVLKLIISDPKS